MHTRGVYFSLEIYFIPIHSPQKFYFFPYGVNFLTCRTFNMWFFFCIFLKFILIYSYFVRYRLNSSNFSKLYLFLASFSYIFLQNYIFSPEPQFNATYPPPGQNEPVTMLGACHILTCTTTYIQHSLLHYNLYFYIIFCTQ